MGPVATMFDNQILDELEPSTAALVRTAARRIRLLRVGPIDAVHRREVVFPTTAVLSTVSLRDDRSMIELFAVGDDGVIGSAVALGGAHPLPGEDTYVRVPGSAWSVPVETVVEAVALDPGFTDGLTSCALSDRVAAGFQTRCAAVHTPCERLARWLLETSTLAGSAEVPVTQRGVAALLGLRAATVNEVAQQLRHEGVVEYDRGSTRILDPVALEAYACQCPRRSADAQTRRHA